MRNNFQTKLNISKTSVIPTASIRWTTTFFLKCHIWNFLCLWRNTNFFLMSLSKPFIWETLSMWFLRMSPVPSAWRRWRWKTSYSFPVFTSFTRAVFLNGWTCLLLVQSAEGVRQRGWGGGLDGGAGEMVLFVGD